VAGFLTFDPENLVVPVSFFQINTTGSVDIVRDTTLLNKDNTHGYLNIESGGTMDIDFKCTPPSTDLACPASNITLHTVRVNGTLQAGALTISSDSFTTEIGGVIDISEGGFLGGKGAGMFMLNLPQIIIFVLSSPPCRTENRLEIIKFIYDIVMRY
jgi:hypothetical protein